MKIVHDLQEWSGLRKAFYGRVGFVATMGALHAGHGSLIKRSVAENAHTVLSIFVNPTQFNNAEDLANYPDTMEQDLSFAKELGVDVVLLPKYDDLYADDYRYGVRESDVSNELCGAHRPGHFDGVLTVVMKLLNIVKAHRAYFGEKDYQQYRLIRDMCKTFFMDVAIVPCPTIREEDGLAMSSRNLRLSSADRKLAPQLNQIIQNDLADEVVATQLHEAGFTVDYVTTLGRRRYVAASLGSGDDAVRLIDNVPAPGLTATVDRVHCQGLIPTATAEHEQQEEQLAVAPDVAAG